MSKEVWKGEYDASEFPPHTVEDHPTKSSMVIVKYEETVEIHAHVETQSRDCDGEIQRGYLMTLQPEERGQEHADILFHDRVVAHIVNSYSLMATGTLNVTRLDDGDVRLHWTEPTEEGFRAAEVTICTDPCDLMDPESWQRDLAAEAAGY